MGDTFDLSIDPPKLDPAASVARHLSNNPEFTEALRDQLGRGVPVTLFGGNHDAQLAQPHVRDKISPASTSNDKAPLSCGVWCAERYGLHLEHGHIYDPDNAQTHPLVRPVAKRNRLGSY